jgi:AAHS family 3-hydroxyphenylpropionic acid transporter
MGIAAPRLAPEFRLTPDQMGWLFAISNIGLVIGASVGGWVADQIGRKPVFIGAVVSFGVFTFATAHAASFDPLLVVRLGVGLGFGAALPNMMAIAADISAPDKRSSTAAAILCGMPFGGGVSALMSQVLPAAFDWRILFYFGGVFPLVLAPALLFFLSETLVRKAGTPLERVSLFTALFGAGRAVPTLLLWLTFLPTLLILYLLLNWLPTLVAANGLDKVVAPQASLAFNLASIFGALIFGALVDRYGARLLVLAYAGLIAALILLGKAQQLNSILILSAAAGVFLMGANYSLCGVAASYYPQAIRGTGSGACIAVGRVGSVIGPLLAGFLLAGGTTAAAVVGYMAPIAAVACVAVLALSFVSARS